MKLAIDIDHDDPAYVETRGGWPLLSHLRAAPDRVEHRRAVITRSFELFDRAKRDGKPEPEIGGLGLLVLQRSLLAAEDLGGLLHAFAGPDPWGRLRMARIPDVDAAYHRAVLETDAVLTESFCLATETQMNEGLSDEERLVVWRARDLVARRWTQMLERSARLWLTLRHVAKATMHGFPIVAGTHVEGPPGAGEIAEGIKPQRQRYALAVTSQVSGNHVTTDRQVILLGQSAVDAYRRDGMTAARLALELCEAHAEGIMGRADASVPIRGVRLLDRESETIAGRIAGYQPRAR